jgi:predicted DNA-binding antitoxin AbrB/MazE fold protein
MPRTIKGKYNKGARVFEPLEHVELANGEVVDITVPDHATSEDDTAFLASAGGWMDIDAEAFIRETYEHRRYGKRPAVEL